MGTTPTRFSRGASVEEVAAALDEAGYAVIEGYLDPADVAAKKADLGRVLESVPTGRNDFEGHATRRIYAFFAKTRCFDAQATDPFILAAVERHLGPHAQLSAPVGISIGPGETAQPLHTDDSVYPLPRPHPELVVNTMWALDDFTADNGATVLYPGSHRVGDPRAAAGDATPVEAVMPAGSVMIYLGSVLHGGGANRTERPRLGVILEFCAGWLRPQENHVLAVPKPVVTDLPPRLQELLGYDVVGLLGNVDGRHPRKYLDDRRQVHDGVVTA